MPMRFDRCVSVLRIRGFLALLLLAAAPLFAQKDIGLTNQIGVASEQYRREKFDEALATLDQLEKASRPTLESVDLRGCIYLEQGKIDAAVKAFEDAHLIKYEAFAPRIHLADALLRQKKFGEARAQYEKLTEVKSPMWPDYARFGVLLCYLAEHDDEGARRVESAIVFPSGSPVYYYAQAAWAFAHGKEAEGKKWSASARKIFDPTKTLWFDRGLYQLGWVKKKPDLAIDPFF
jgi:tetratricopeptide (TPR) repeat protein